MKLLLDENLSRRLLEDIQDLFLGSLHVAQAGLGNAPDRHIWNYAGQNAFTILTADTDFLTFANTLGPPPKVILLENCDYPTIVAAQVIPGNSDRMLEFERSRDALLILRKP